MIKRISASWFKYLVEALTLTFILGLFGGIVIGLLRGWKYGPKGLFLLILDTLNFSINESLLIAIAFLFLFLYLLVFLALYRVIKRTKWTCFVSSAVISVPAFLYLGYRINTVYLPRFFELKSIIWNLVIGIGFIFLWLLVSIGLFFWTRSRILKIQTVNVKRLGLFVGIVLIFNVSAYLFYNFYTVKSDSPNVMIILIDALRADRLSCYGYSRKTTPNIDKFAKDSVLFTQAISQSTWTKASIASLFTSLYPYQHQVYRSLMIRDDVLGEEKTTLAEVLLQNGFLTMAWVHQPFLRSYLGFSQGFVDYNDQPSGIDSINKKFMRWAKRIGKRHKFFAYLHYLDLHEPYQPRPPYDTMYGVYSDLYSRVDLKNWFSFVKEIREGKRKLEKKDLDQLIAYNDGQLTYIDSQIGLLLEELKKEGLYDNTLIIITADHGDGFMEHGFISHSNTPYEELIRVLLIIKFPNSLYKGKVVKSQVRLIDVMPTILHILKIKTDVKLSGFSLLNYLDNKIKKIDFPKYAISEIPKNIFGYHGYPTVSIRTERFKYIDFPDKKDEFYDLSVDPREQNNIIDLKRDEAEKLHRISLAIALERKEKRDMGKVVLDKKAIEELRALGYVQ